MHEKESEPDQLSVTLSESESMSNICSARERTIEPNGIKSRE
jgi:hypothetical protein